MIYLIVVIVVAGLLLVRWTRLQARTRKMTALVEGLSRAEAQAEYDRCLMHLTDGLTAGAPASAQGRTPVEQRNAARAESGLHVDALAERGAWMMDRIRGLDGQQTGPAQRIRAKMEMMDAAARNAQGAGKQD